ncbi:helix-turn-helix domain-containing protein [Caldimonas sp. KR1-144]|uniref:helix-turn-helix domain-containing protein n=1 Tax=Caldimonas sp. KR1-144 TaxID=3400911 RepID=UPI003C12A0B9
MLVVGSEGTDAVPRAPLERAAWQVRSRLSADVDEHAAHLSGWRQSYDQLGSGRFSGRLDEAVGEGVQLFRERTSRQLRQRCEVWRDAIWCGITLADDGSRLDGRQVGAGAVMASGSDGGFELVSPAGHDIVGFVVAREALAAHAPELAWPREAAAAWWPIDPARRQRALAHARAILALAAAGADAELRGAMLEVVAGLLDARVPRRRERGNASARRRLVAQVHERLEAAPERVPSVPELCEALHVSRRTLQYAFEDEVGLGPLAYLRSVRLNGVRRLLRAAAPGMTVQRAAAQWGFWNLSAFALDYRRQFGERASQTLARAGASIGR